MTKWKLPSDSVYDSIAYDPVKIRLSESETEAEEQANHNAEKWARPRWKFWQQSRKNKNIVDVEQNFLLWLFLLLILQDLLV